MKLLLYVGAAMVVIPVFGLLVLAYAHDATLGFLCTIPIGFSALLVYFEGVLK